MITHNITPHQSHVPALLEGVELLVEPVEHIISKDNSPYQPDDTLCFKYWRDEWIDTTIESGYYEKRLKELPVKYKVLSVEVEKLGELTIEEVLNYIYGWDKQGQGKSLDTAFSEVWNTQFPDHPYDTERYCWKYKVERINNE